MQEVDLTSQYGQVPYPNRDPNLITDFIVHHAQGTLPTSLEHAKRVIADIHAFHVNTRGWPGFAYHRAAWEDYYFLVRPRNRNGWHTGGMDVSPRNGIGDGNDRGIACVLLGNFTSSTPSSTTLRTVAEGKKFEEANLGRTLALSGHQEWSSTACPGEGWRFWRHTIEEAYHEEPPVEEPVPEFDACHPYRIAIAHMADVIVMDGLNGGVDPQQVIFDVQAIRTQFVGPRP